MLERKLTVPAKYTSPPFCGRARNQANLKPVQKRRPTIERSATELEPLAQKLWQENARECPDCQQPTLDIGFDEHYLLLKCSKCTFHYTEYFGD